MTEGRKVKEGRTEEEGRKIKEARMDGWKERTHKERKEGKTVCHLRPL